MTVSKARNIATFLGRTDSANPNELRLLHTGELTGIDSDTVLSINGVQFFNTLDSLPVSNLREGQQAFVDESKRLYVSNGSGYYNALTVNNAPFWDSVPLDEYTIVDSATPLIIKADPGDSDGTELFINQSFGSDSAQFMATVTNDSSVFTFTPKTKAEIASAVAAGNLTDSDGDFTYTFKWSDGINFVAKAANIIYNTASTASGPNNQVAFRGFRQGTFGSTFGSSTSSATMLMPSGTQVGDQAILVVGGLGWTALNGSAQVTVPDDFSYNGNAATPTYQHQWGYASGQSDYRTDVYINSAVSADMLSNGVTIQNNEASGGTSYVLFSMVTLGGGNTPLFNHAQINYPGNYVANTYYSVASAAPPTNYQYKNGIIEIHTSRYGTRNFTNYSNISQHWMSIYRSIYYVQACYRNYLPSQISGANPLQQPYHRFQHLSNTQYSSSSLVIAY